MDALAIIGFGGALPFLVFLIVLNYKKLSIGGVIFMSFLLYIISLVTGILSNEILRVGNTQSAYVAGIIAPAFYLSIFTIIIRYTNLLKFIRKKRSINLHEDMILDQSLEHFNED